MTKIKLHRDGKRSLAFMGEEIAKASNIIQGGNHANRWTDVRIYRTESGKFVVGIAHHTQWQYEQDSYSAHVCDSPVAVIDLCEEHVPHLASELANAEALQVVEEI